MTDPASPVKPAGSSRSRTGQPAAGVKQAGAGHTNRGQARPRLIVSASLASSAGLVVHNLFDFPWPVLYHAETTGPIILTGLLAGAALARPGRVTALALGGWGLVTVVGGGLSVLPLPFLPFAPDQTVGHYTVHAVYAAAQIPLLHIGRHALGQAPASSQVTTREPGHLVRHDETESP